MANTNEGRKSPFDSKLPVENVLTFLQNIEKFHPESCAGIYSTPDEVVAVFGQGNRVADIIRRVSMDDGFGILGVHKLEPKLFEGTPEEIDRHVEDRINLLIRQSHPSNKKKFRLVNVQTPLWNV